MLIDVENPQYPSHEKTPKPLANQVKDMTVIAAVMRTTPMACLSWSDSAPLHVGHLKSPKGVYGCLPKSVT